MYANDVTYYFSFMILIGETFIHLSGFSISSLNIYMNWINLLLKDLYRVFPSDRCDVDVSCY